MEDTPIKDNTQTNSKELVYPIKAGEAHFDNTYATTVLTGITNYFLTWIHFTYFLPELENIT